MVPPSRPSRAALTAMESEDDVSVGSDVSAGPAGRDSARRPSPVSRVTAAAITRRALRRALADDTATLSQLVSAGALDGSSGSSAGGSDSDSSSSSDGDAGGGAPDPGALRRELVGLRRGMRKLRRVVRLQQRVVAAQQEILAVGASAPVPLHEDLAPFHGATARRLPRLDAAARRSLESALPRVEGFCRWVGPSPTYPALLSGAGASAPFLATSAGATLATRFLRAAESVAGLYALLAEPEPPSDDDVRAGLVSVFRLLLGGVAAMDTAGRLAGLRAVAAGRVPDSAGLPGGEDALLADADLSRLLEERKTVASFATLARPSAGAPSVGAPAVAQLSKSQRRRQRRKKAAAGSAGRDARPRAAPPASADAGSGAPDAGPRRGQRGRKRPASAGGRSARQ
ncbi:MAG: hypothetical protein GY772_24090 [bacterium]|nr:hypothetical protein [bacterium]